MSDNLHYEPPPSPAGEGEGPAASPPKKKKRSGSETRQRDEIIPVRCKAPEAAIIRENAAAVNLKPCGFLRALGTGEQRPNERRPPLPELLPYKNGVSKINVAASNCHQFLRAMNCGELVDIPELRSAAAKLDACADEMLEIIRGYLE